jgi:cystathionine beta-lyase/cystathionine gamma-synthase
MTEHELHFATLAVHAGLTPEPTTGALTPPVFQTSTYAKEALGQPRGGYEYARGQNPTREALEGHVAALEGAHHGIAFASGVAAIEAIAKRLSAGDHIVCDESAYGGTRRLFEKVLARLGLDFTFVDASEPQRIRDALRPNTRLIHVETPSNPLMRLCDLRTVSHIAREAGVPLSVDNSFATPYNQRPLERGATIVVHSSSKYLNGHSDVIGGIVVTNDDEIAGELRFLQKVAGAIPAPWDAWLVLRGTKTLHLRMEAHNRNAERVAMFLERHPGVERVYYPGIPSHPQHELARHQMRGFSGMVSLELGSLERAEKLMARTRIFAPADSLGGVESLIGHPATQTHTAFSPAEREALGVTDGLIRLSVGVEEADDLIADLDQALRGL